MKRWAGPLITLLILAGVMLILLMNLIISPSPGDRAPASPVMVAPLREKVKTEAPAPKQKGNFREYPIGDEVEKNGMRIAAVWLPPVRMDEQDMGGSDVIHLEADVKATEGNPHGFALGEFVPYLKIAYEIVPSQGGPPIQKGDLMPMVASDGLHYGASVSMPRAGDFRLTYKIQPPSAGGLCHHSDPVTGVAPWWTPFEATFAWEYPGPPAPAR
jgi:periplasmic iron binding protein